MTRQKTRVLYLIENERYGGGERAFAQLVRGLDKSSYEIFVACLADPSVSGSAPFLSAVAGHASLVGLDMRSLFNPLSILAVKKIILDKGIDLVHSQGARADFYARMACVLCGRAALISTVAAPVEEYDVSPLRKIIYRAVDRFAGGCVDRFITVANHLTEKLERARKISRSRITRIYNGVEFETYAFRPESAARQRAKLGIDADCFLVGAFSRLSPEKGLFNLVAAAKITAAAGARIKYLVAGEGPLEKELKAQVENLGLEQAFIFTGFVSDVAPLMGAVDLFLLPSLREGFPVGVLEAMALGKPVVASEIDGINESVLDGQSGLLVPSGDSPGLARAIMALAEDRHSALKMGERGRAIVLEKFGLAKMIEAHDAVYAEVLKGEPVS